MRVRRFVGQYSFSPTARSTPFLCSCAKKRGGAPKKRAYGCRHGGCSVPPASPTDSKPQHHSRLRQADLSAQITTHPLPKSGEDDPRPPRQERSRGWWSHRSKKALFFGGSTPFLLARQKKWGRMAGQAIDHLPAYRRTRTSPAPSRARNVPTTDRQRSREWWSRRGKKAPFFGGSTPFLWASTKEMGSNRRTSHRPPPNVSAHTYQTKRTNKRGNPRRGFPLGPPPALK